MNSNKIDAIVFDFGNVIINIDLEKTYEAFSELTFKSVDTIKRLFAENDVFKNYEIGKFTDDEFRDVIRQICGYPLNDDEIDHAWNALLLDIPIERFKYLEDLRLQRPIYLLSNTSNIHIEFCKQYARKKFGIIDFTSLFSKVYLSYELGLWKPEYKIYDHVIKDIGVKAENILFFDDNADNVNAAKDMGINAIKIEPPQDFMPIFAPIIMNKGHIYKILFFVLTLITTTIAGAEWISGKSLVMQFSIFTFEDLLKGFWFSIPFLGFLTFHEFGHYFTARIKKIDVSLPFYIPAWFGVFMSIGTFGAFIRIKQEIKSRKDYFDVAIAGPLAGFVVALGCLIIGFSSIKSNDFIYSVHPEYKLLKNDYRIELDKKLDNPNAVILGESLLFTAVKNTFSDPKYLPHKFEISHYPLILAGFLGLLFTAINLLPIGQLDGGHILFAMVGKKAFDIISPSFLVLLLFYGGLGLFRLEDAQSADPSSFYLQFAFYVLFMYLSCSKIFPKVISNVIVALSIILLQLLLISAFPSLQGYQGILLFGLMIGRFLGVYHPAVSNLQKLDLSRILLGILAIFIFVICFTPNPIA